MFYVCSQNTTRFTSTRWLRATTRWPCANRHPNAVGYLRTSRTPVEWPKRILARRPDREYRRRILLRAQITCTYRVISNRFALVRVYGRVHIIHVVDKTFGSTARKRVCNDQKKKKKKNHPVYYTRTVYAYFFVLIMLYIIVLQ